MTTSPENIVCYSSDSLEDCPITEIKFMNESEVDALDETEFTKVFFMEDTYLVYSKTMTNNLPITSTDISV